MSPVRLRGSWIASRSLNDQYPGENDVGAVYREIVQFAEGLKQKRDTAAAEASSIVRDMQATQNIAELLSLEKRVEDASKNWPDDAYLQSLVDQASARVGEVRSHKRQALDELAQIEKTLATARSAGQLRLLEEQARVVSSDLIGDADVEAAIGRIGLIEQDKLKLIDGICSTLKDFATKIASAETLVEAEDYATRAKSAASGGMNFEEVDELLRKVQRPIEERKKDYTRIERNLTLLIESSAKATGLAELDLILARRRDLLKKYSGEVCFQKLQEQLEVSVSARRAYLTELAASEQQAEGSAEEAEFDESQFALNASGTSVGAAPTLRISAVQQPQAQRRHRLLVPLLSAAGLLTIAGLALVFFPRTVSIRVDPATANVAVDGQPCNSPCQVRLSPGRHEVVASADGFERTDQIVSVPWSGGELAPITMTKVSAPVAPPTVAVSDSGNLTGGNAKIIVMASLPGVQVFLDDHQMGATGRDGNLDVVTMAGQHKLSVAKPGFQQVDPMSIRLDKGKAATIVFRLTQAPSVETARNVPSGNPAQTPAPAVNATPAPSASVAPQPPPDSFVVLKAPAGAEVHIDQQSSGHSMGDPFRIKVGPGQHTVEVFLSGYQPWKQAVSVDLGKQVDVVANLTAIPVVSARPTTPPPASGVSDDDRKQIQSLLDRYGDGYNQKNVKLIQAAWPSIPQEKLKTIKDFLHDRKSVNMKLSLISAIPAGKRITVDCTQTLRFDDNGKERNMTSQITLYVVKRDSGWEIDFVPNT